MDAITALASDVLASLWKEIVQHLDLVRTVSIEE